MWPRDNVIFINNASELLEKMYYWDWDVTLAERSMSITAIALDIRQIATQQGLMRVARLVNICGHIRKVIFVIDVPIKAEDREQCPNLVTIPLAQVLLAQLPQSNDAMMVGYGLLKRDISCYGIANLRNLNTLGFFGFGNVQYGVARWVDNSR